MGFIMKNPNFYALVLLMSVTCAFFSCKSTAAEKEVSVQKLIMEGRYDEARDLFKTKTDITSIINRNIEIEKNQNNLMKVEGENGAKEQDESEVIELTKDMIMEVTCTMSEEGLGPLKWWKETKI